MDKRKIPKCRSCSEYDRFRNRCRVDKTVRVMNGVPRGSCPKDCNGVAPEKQEDRNEKTDTDQVGGPGQAGGGVPEQAG